jgi:hypothetical protein
MLHAWQSHGQRRGSDGSWSTLAGMPVTVVAAAAAPSRPGGPVRPLAFVHTFLAGGRVTRAPGPSAGAGFQFCA